MLIIRAAHHFITVMTHEFCKVCVLALKGYLRYNRKVLGFLREQMQHMEPFWDHPPEKPDDISDVSWQEALITLRSTLDLGDYLYEQHCSPFNLSTFYKASDARKAVETMCQVLGKLAKRYFYKKDIYIKETIPGSSISYDEQDLHAKLDYVLNDKPLPEWCISKDFNQQEWGLVKKEHKDRIKGLKIITVDENLQLTEGKEEGFWFNWEVTAKQAIPTQSELDLERFAEFFSEVAIMGSLRNPFVTDFWGATMSGLLIMERSQGDLVDWYRQKPDLNWALKIKALTAAATGLEYVHSQKIVHRDVNSRNFRIFDKDPMVRIADFSTARTLDDIRTKTVRSTGTFLYVAPEIHRGSPHSRQSDVFSFGVVIHEVAAQREPYRLQRQDSNATLVERKEREDSPCRVPENCPSDLKTIMQKCCSRNPSKRPSMADVRRFLEEMSQGSF